MIDNKISNFKGFRNIFILIDNFSKYLWCVPPKNRNNQILLPNFSIILTKSKRSPLEIESDRGADFYNSIFQNFLNSKNIQPYSRFTNKGPCVAERVIRSVRSLLKKPVFEKKC